MNKTNLILQRLAKAKTRNVKLSIIRDVVDDYKTTINDYDAEVQRLIEGLSEVLDASQSLLSINKALEAIYFQTDDIYNKAVEVGLEDMLPSEINNIFELGVMAGLSRMEGSFQKITDFCIENMQNEFKHLD